MGAAGTGGAQEPEGRAGVQAGGWRAAFPQRRDCRLRFRICSLNPGHGSIPAQGTCPVGGEAEGLSLLSSLNPIQKYF